jgi:hypothetical protein
MNSGKRPEKRRTTGTMPPKVLQVLLLIAFSLISLLRKFPRGLKFLSYDYFCRFYPFQAFSGLYEDRKGSRKLKNYVKNKCAGR